MATVIIGCSGIGGAIARRLASQGRPVHLVGRASPRLESLASSLGSSCLSTTHADVASTAAYEAALATVAARGGLSGLVYSVGTIPLKPLARMSASDALEAFTVNTLGAMLAVKALAPALGQGPTPGSVVLFSTVAASVGFPNHSAIAAAKGGVEAFVRAAAAELAPRVRVNALAPSLTDTPLAARMLTTEAMRKALGDAHPIPRLGTSEELAQLAVMLLTPEVCGWINGQIWQVDGGRSTVRPKN